jgi:hypothetical protein
MLNQYPKVSDKLLRVCPKYHEVILWLGQKTQKSKSSILNQNKVVKQVT